MGKRLTPEEKEARLKAYEEAKAEKAAARLEKRKARVEAYEKAKAERKRKKEYEKKGIKPAELSENSKAGQAKRFPTYQGEIEVGDEVGFRFLNIAMAGKLESIERVRNYRVRETEEGLVEEEDTGKNAFINFYQVIENSTGIVYPIRRNDILARKVNNIWYDEFNRRYLR